MASSDVNFKNVGVALLAFSGRSVSLEIHPTPDPIFTKTYYISREHLAQLLHGHRKEATIYIKIPKENVSHPES